MHARNRSGVLETLMFLLLGLKGENTAVTGSIQHIHGWDHTYPGACVHECVRRYTHVHMYIRTYSNTGKQGLRKACPKRLVNNLARNYPKGSMGDTCFQTNPLGKSQKDEQYPWTWVFCACYEHFSHVKHVLDRMYS